jgi:hypothetical protein
MSAITPDKLPAGDPSSVPRAGCTDRGTPAGQVYDSPVHRGANNERRPDPAGGARPAGPVRRPTSSGLRCLLAVAAVALLAACGTARSSSSPPPSRPTTAASASTPSPAVQAATLSATDGYRRFVETASERFAADTARLEADIAAGDLDGARSDELVAQGDYDALRSQLTWNASATLALDARSTDVAPGTPFTGLHRIEQGLWPGGTDWAAGTAPASATLADDAAPLPVALQRVVQTPQQILQTAVDELGWIDASPVPGLEEAYSHLDTVDVAAGVDTVTSVVGSVTALGELLAPTETAVALGRLATLTADVAALGPPGMVPDDAISPAAWRTVAQQVDATAAALSTLDADLSGPATGAAFGSYGRY